LPVVNRRQQRSRNSGCSARDRPALLLCFRARWLGGLHVLGGEVATQASPPSTHLASQIARAEAVPLRPVASG